YAGHLFTVQVQNHIIGPRNHRNPQVVLPIPVHITVPRRNRTLKKMSYKIAIGIKNGDRGLTVLIRMNGHSEGVALGRGHGALGFKGSGSGHQGRGSWSMISIPWPDHRWG